MRILFVARGMGPVTPKTTVSTETYLYWLVRELSRIGHDVAIISPEFDNFVSGRRDKDSIRFFLTKNSYGPKHLEEICAFLPKWEWDVVHVDSSLWYIPQIKMLAKVPVVGFIHSNLTIGLAPLTGPWAITGGLHVADAFLFNSEFVRRETIALHPVVEKKAHVVGLGADTNFFRPGLTDAANALRKRWMIGNRQVLLFSSPLSQSKGLTKLQKAVLGLQADLRQRVVIVVVGSDSPPGSAKDPNRKEIHDLWQLQKCPMVWIGPRPFTEMPAWYNLALAHVCPATDEAFGTLKVESGACGIPTIATKTGGSPEVITDGEDGLLVPVDDTEALRAAITRLLTEPDLAAQLGATARQRAVERWDWSVIARRFLAVYESLK